MTDNIYAFQNESKTKQTRKRIVFAALPIIKNKRISWLRKTKILERKYMSWCDIFDSIGNETFATKPHGVWKIEMIEN
jgi:hypothetical protein